ncbi:hypothetical protein IQ241_22025 [Romeria aff. gracilis LEGE 07310]|uniref:Uncharacterized protein n=1 Tax=Vasconcelosia minhoensis LEGE 07310 TaxID=915328 RepID=A0A8J7AJ61_9CYAN|nr:hypothetical protein [Romeria gracilis]MBE9079934.1 hypothetical protein [Romeria aff. gracilis LEGE 07310]
MPVDFQTFVAIFTALLVFLTSVVLSYDTLEFTQYRIVLPQWAGLLLAAVTFFTVAVDQILRGFVRVEEAERAARRARIEAGCRAGQIRFQLEPNEDHRRQLAAVLALLEEYRQTL